MLLGRDGERRPQRPQGPRPRAPATVGRAGVERRDRDQPIGVSIRGGDRRAALPTLPRWPPQTIHEPAWPALARDANADAGRYGRPRPRRGRGLSGAWSRADDVVPTDTIRQRTRGLRISPTALGRPSRHRSRRRGGPPASAVASRSRAGCGQRTGRASRTLDFPCGPRTSGGLEPGYAGRRLSHMRPIVGCVAVAVSRETVRKGTCA